MVNVNIVKAIYNDGQILCKKVDDKVKCYDTSKIKRDDLTLLKDSMEIKFNDLPVEVKDKILKEVI